MGGLTSLADPGGVPGGATQLSGNQAQSNLDFAKFFGGSTSQSSSQETSNPINLQNPSYVGLAPTVAQGITQQIGGGQGIQPVLNQATGQNFNFGQVSGNPLVAPTTAQQNSLVAQAGNQAAPNPTVNAGMNALGGILSPNFLNTAQNPNVQAAVQGAVAPMVSAFQDTTVPSLQGQFTAAGQNVNNVNGSSAFDRAVGIAQNNLEQNIGQTTSGIENQAYQNAIQTQVQAAATASGIQTSELNNTVNALQASALPQLIQQYGINQGLQLFQNMTQSILQAIGLGGQVSQPVIGNVQQGTSQGTSFGSKGIIGGVEGMF